MELAERLLELRKSKHLSQEELAYQLNVTRQTVSKWETGASVPDFDKIIPICQLYGISADELLTGVSSTCEHDSDDEILKQRKEIRARRIVISVFLYFLSVCWIMVSIPVMNMEPVLASSIFMLICAVATCLVVYANLSYRSKEKRNVHFPIVRQINSIILLVFTIIYLVLSFVTMAWNITWILWIVCVLVQKIVKLVFMLRSGNYEK